MEFLEAQACKTCLKFLYSTKAIVVEHIFTFMISKDANHNFSSNNCAKSRLSLYMVVRPQCMAVKSQCIYGNYTFS